jgi:trehalose 6-phosphate phosphatase
VPPGELGALELLLDSPSSSAVLTDFDGTLAPIVADPDEARPLREAPEVLAKLAATFAVVGVVSGRPAAFLEAHLASAGPAVHLVGLYGSEWVLDGEVRRAPEAEAWVERAEEVLRAARAEAPPGLGIEDKGVSVTLHWRRAPDAGEWAVSFAEHWAARTGFVLQPGRRAVELRPPIDLDKGKVLLRLAGRCSAVCFAGDDTGDLAAFEALDELAKKGVATARIAVADEESPPKLVATADIVVEGPGEALALLDRLAEAAARVQSR